MFSIFNDGVNTLNYSIVKTAAWITSVSSESGTLQAGATMPIVVVIDRDKMSVGENKTTLHITSNDGSKQMTIKAEKLGEVSTLEAEEVNYTKATLRACVNIDVPYSERGFYYGTNTNSLTKVVVEGTGMGVYKHQLYNLEKGKKYYYKAYLINNSETVYGSVKEFDTKIDIHNGHEYVNLGLPSGLKWATCNSGAGSPEEYGNYLNFEEAKDATWGGNWRCPTKSEWEELKSNCAWTWTTKDGVKGYEVVGSNGNSIFLPAAGFRNGSSLHYVGSDGYYWSSTPYSSGDNYAYYFYFDSGGQDMNYYSRSYGRSVRLVAE